MGEDVIVDQLIRNRRANRRRSAVLVCPHWWGNSVGDSKYDLNITTMGLHVISSDVGNESIEVKMGDTTFNNSSNH